MVLLLGLAQFSYLFSFLQASILSGARFHSLVSSALPILMIFLPCACMSSPTHFLLALVNNVKHRVIELWFLWQFWCTQVARYDIRYRYIQSRTYKCRSKHSNYLWTKHVKQLHLLCFRFGLICTWLSFKALAAFILPSIPVLLSGQDMLQ